MKNYDNDPKFQAFLQQGKPQIETESPAEIVPEEVSPEEVKNAAFSKDGVFFAKCAITGIIFAGGNLVLTFGMLGGAVNLIKPQDLPMQFYGCYFMGGIFTFILLGAFAQICKKHWMSN